MQARHSLKNVINRFIDEAAYTVIARCEKLKRTPTFIARETSTHTGLVSTSSGRYYGDSLRTWGIGMSTLNLSKTERIDVRASSAVKQLLQEAARSCHKNVSEFLLDAGVIAANQALADRRHFVLNDEQWQAFEQALDRPVQTKSRLKKLLSEPGVLG